MIHYGGNNKKREKHMTETEAKKFNAEVADRLCTEAGCGEKKRKIHFDQLVHRAWNPHPSEAFVKWWHTQPEFRIDGVDAVRARNCKVFCDRFKEARQFGIESLPVSAPRTEYS